MMIMMMMIMDGWSATMHDDMYTEAVSEQISEGQKECFHGMCGLLNHECSADRL